MRVVEEREGGRRWGFGEKAAEGTGSAKEDCVLSALSISTHVHTHAVQQLQQLQQPRSLRVTCRLPQSLTYKRLAVTEPPQLPLTSEAPNHNYSNLTQSSLPLPILFPSSSRTLPLPCHSGPRTGCRTRRHGRPPLRTTSAPRPRRCPPRCPPG